MNEGSSSSASHSGTTPGSAAPNTAQNSSNPEGPALTEAQALQQQAEEARQAIARTIALLGKNLGTSVDPRAWTQSHPWITLGSAAVGGFIATTLLVPSAEDRALRRLAAIERAVAPKVPIPIATSQKEVTGQKGLFQNLIGEILKTARPIIVSAISAGIASQQAAATAQHVAEDEDTSTGSSTTTASTTPPAI